MRGLFPAIVALAVAAVVAFESAGVMNGFEYDASVRCCCGTHDEGHACGCPACPGTGRLRFTHARRASSNDSAGDRRAATLRPCRGRRPRGALGDTPALAAAPVARPTLLADARRAPATPIRRLFDRLTIPTRPPP